MKGPKLAVLLAVAALAVGVQNYVFFSELPGSGPATRRPPPEGDGEFEQAAADDAAGLGVLDGAGLAAWLGSQRGTARNPFVLESEEVGYAGPRPLSGPAVPQLSGTLWSRGRRVAWLDGRPLSEGDRVGDYRIAAIETWRVVLERDGLRIPVYAPRLDGSWPTEAPKRGH